MSRTASPLCVLLTGATGLLGSSLLARLLERGHRVRVIGRRRGPVTPDERMRRILSCHGLQYDSCDGRLDVLDETLLGRPRASRALKRVDAVIHAAAAVKFDSRLVDLIEQNCEATRRLIGLLDVHAPDAHFHFVSTAYVHGRGSSVAAERVTLPPGSVRHAYELTKRQSEELVVDLSRRSGRPFSILRPSIIAGDSRDGTAANFNGIYALLRLADELSRSRLRGERATIRCNPEGTKNIVPVDWAARAIVALTERGAASAVFHLTHPRPIEHRQLVAMLGRITGFAGLDVAAECDRPGQRTRLQRVVDRSLRLFAPYLWEEPLFDRSNLERQLGDLSVPPPVDERYLQRLIEFGRRVRWVERPLEGLQLSDRPLSA